MSDEKKEVANLPSTNVANREGRDSSGKFAKGNPGGPGNPMAQKVHKLRAALLRQCSVKDIGEVAQMLITQAKSGDVTAARELLDRLLGKPKVGLEISGPDGDALVIAARRAIDMTGCLDQFDTFVGQASDSRG